MPKRRKQTRFSWEASQKEWIKSWHAKLRTEVKRLEVQVARFKQALPDLAPEAEIAAWPFLESGRQLLRLSWKNKFNPISQEVAENEVQRLEAKRELWVGFTRRSDVAEAIAQTNKKTRKVKAERQEVLRCVEQKFVVYTNSPAFAQALETSRAAIQQHAKEISQLLRGLAEYGTKQDFLLIERLLLVHFIRATYEFDPAIRQSISDYLKANPKSQFEELLTYAIRAVVLKTSRHKLRTGISVSAGMSHSRSIMISYLDSVSQGLSLSMRKWRQAGVLSDQLAGSYFSVLGVDCSLQAKPI